LSVLSTVETVLGFQLDQDGALEALAQRSSTEWLERLCQALLPLGFLDQEQRLTYVPRRKADELQPYFPYNIAHDDVRFVGGLPAYRGIGTTVDVPTASALFARHLLYCNRVVLNDPMWWVICDSVGSYGPPDWRLAEADREKLRSRRDLTLHWLDLLRKLRPLIMGQRIVFLPPNLRPYVPQLDMPNVRQPADLADSPDLEELHKEVMDDARAYGYDTSNLTNIDLSKNSDRIFFAKAWFLISVRDMNSQLLTAMSYENRLDLAPVSILHPLALQLLLAQGLTAPEGVIKAPEQMKLLKTLVRLPVFLNLGDNPGDVANIAISDEGFAAWRRGMSRALDKIARYEPTSWSFEGAVRLAFEDELAEPVQSLRRAQRKASWAGALRPALTDVGISAVGSAAAGGVAALAGAGVLAAAAPFGVAGVALAYGGRAIWTYCRGGAARKQGAAATSLYNILSKSA